MTEAGRLSSESLGRETGQLRSTTDSALVGEGKPGPDLATQSPPPQKMKAWSPGPHLAVIFLTWFPDPVTHQPHTSSSKESSTGCPAPNPTSTSLIGSANTQSCCLSTSSLSFEAAEFPGQRKAHIFITNISKALGTEKMKHPFCVGEGERGRQARSKKEGTRAGGAVTDFPGPFDGHPPPLRSHCEGHPCPYRHKRQNTWIIPVLFNPGMGQPPPWPSDHIRALKGSWCFQTLCSRHRNSLASRSHELL